MKFLMPSEVPNYEQNLSVEDAVVLIETALQNLGKDIEVVPGPNGIAIGIYDAEDRRSEISIPARLFAPEAWGFAFPMYLLERSTAMRSKVDYFGSNPDFNQCIVNQNKMLFMILQQNAEVQRSFEDNSIDFIVNSTEMDVRNLMSGCEFRIQNSYNSTLKAQHAMVVVSPFVFNNTSGTWEWRRIADNFGLTDRMYTLGYHIGNGRRQLTERDMDRLMRDLPVHPTSESMLSTSNKLIVKPYNSALYKAAAFGYHKLPTGQIAVDTLFENKASIPSRWKTHILADAFIAHRPDEPLDSRMPEKDDTIKNAIVAFVPFDQDNFEFVCGEMDISREFAQNMQKRIIRRTLVKPSVTQMQMFKKPEGFDGDYEVRIGFDAEGRPVSLSGFDRIDIVDVIEHDDQGYQVVAECWRPIGCGRLYSQTGLKGVSKVRPRMPIATITNKQTGEEIQLPVDIMAGMNSVKAKHNTIRHAMACLAAKLEWHTDRKIDGLNEGMVNNLSEIVGLSRMTMPDGTTRDVIIGLVQVAQNESAYMFSEEKLQKMSPEGIKYLANAGGIQSVKSLLADEDTGAFPTYMDDFMLMRAEEIRANA